MDQATKWLDLSGKVVVVTGGSMGLGEKMVENLYANGATVVYADLSPNKNFSQFDDIIFIKCDVTKKTEVEQLTASVVKRFGHIDGLVNNAGVSRPRLLVDVFKEKPEYCFSGIAVHWAPDGRTRIWRHYQYDFRSWCSGFTRAELLFRNESRR